MERKVQQTHAISHAPTAKSRLLSGVLILTVANIFVKILGFVYKVPLNALLGDEMANVNAAYTVYALLYTASTAGIPGAISLSVSRARALGRHRRVRLVLEGSLLMLLSVGFLLSLLLLLLARPLSLLNSDGDSYLCMLAIAPALFFTAVTSVFRGFFQGHGQMAPTAVSECLEALGKAVFGIGFSLLCVRALGKSVRTAAALSVFGITLGVAMGAAFLAVCYAGRGKTLLLPAASEAQEESRRAVLRSVVATALPITLSSAMMSLSSFLDAQLMRPLLTAHYADEALAKALYSDYSTGAVTLYNLPAVLITPLAVAMIPYVAEALVRGEKERARRAMESALRLAAILSLPCAFGMSALASPILSFVFRGDTDMAQNAGASLSVLAVSVFFVAMLTVTSSALQAAKKEKKPILSLAVGVGVKLLSMPLFVRLLGEVGVAVSTLLFFVTAALLNLIFLKGAVGLHVRLSAFFLRPAIAAVLTAASALGIYLFARTSLGETLALFLAIIAAVLLYLLLLGALRAVGREEMRLLPFGERIISRFGFLVSK